MRPPARFVVAMAWLLAAGASTALGQSTPSPVAPASGSAASGTLQVPAKPHHDQPMTPAKAAPLVPVHKATNGAKNVAKTPVVPPRGPSHPRKPISATGPVKPVPVPVLPPAVAPAQPAPEAKAAPPDKVSDAEKPEGAAPKLPRFASLRSDDVNMRVGPGSRYRIEWVYKRRDLPVEIEREFDVWRWVRDADGIQGWVHQATLMGRRSFIVQNMDATMRSTASDTGAPVAILKPGVIGRIRSCEAASAWCNVSTGSYRGYLRRDQFWGLLPDEAIAP